MGTVEAVAAGAAVVLFSATAGAGVGVLEVYLFYRPDRRHGPTARIQQAMLTGTLLLAVGLFWGQALGLLAADAGTDPIDRTVSVPLAVGFTLGSGWLGQRRWRRYRRMLRPEPAAGSARTTGAGSAESPGATAVPAWRRRLRLAFRSLDYAMGALFCYGAIIGAAAVSDEVRTRSGTWFSGHAHAVTLVGTQVVLLVVGISYSQLVSGVARKALDVALARGRLLRRA